MRQQKDDIISEAQSVLIDIQRITQKKNSDIARDLGVDYRTLWALEKGKSGSTQLLNGLKLLKQVIDLQNLMSASDENMKRIVREEVQQALSSGSRRQKGSGPDASSDKDRRD